jgi:gliding motility-associated-like protein
MLFLTKQVYNKSCTYENKYMLKKYRLLLMFGILLFSTSRLTGQMTMPDNVSVGQTRLYHVEPAPGSSYNWWIDGELQAGFTTNEFVHTWRTADTFLLEVQERPAEGCPGPVRSGQVYVNVEHDASLIIHNAFSPDGDLINDVWNIGNIGLYPNMVITIYNRWGQPIWKSGAGYPEPWDGKSNGSDLPIDSYHYVIDLHNGTRPIVGFITIVR